MKNGAKEGKKFHRIDRKHRFPLRIQEDVHSEMDALAFRCNVSLNVAYCEAIAWSLQQDAFRRYMEGKFPRDERRGHYVYIRNYTDGR